eukprot:7628708-Alexandrium_andersonii.AAC.1
MDGWIRTPDVLPINGCHTHILAVARQRLAHALNLATASGKSWKALESLRYFRGCALMRSVLGRSASGFG